MINEFASCWNLEESNLLNTSLWTLLHPWFCMKWTRICENVRFQQDTKKRLWRIHKKWNGQPMMTDQISILLSSYEMCLECYRIILLHGTKNIHYETPCIKNPNTKTLDWWVITCMCNSVTHCCETLIVVIFDMCQMA